MPVPTQSATAFFGRAAQAKRCAEKTGRSFYKLEERDIEGMLDAIRCGISEKLCSWGRLHIHHCVYRTESVYCAYDAALSRIGFFIRPALGEMLVEMVSRD